MLLQTNSYVVPREKRSEHARLLRRFRSTLAKLGCDQFEAYEQVGPNWNNNEATGRYVQIMRFRDRKHQLQVQQAERHSPAAQQVIAEFCRLINFPYQQQQGLFAVGYYTAVLCDLSARQRPAAAAEPFGGAAAAAAAAGAAPFGTSFRPAEEAPAEEAPAEAETYTEEVAATAVDLAEEQVEESDLAPEDLPAEELSASDDGAADTLDEAPDADAVIDEQWVEEEPVESPPPAPVPAARPAPIPAPAPARGDGRARTPAVPPAPPPVARSREVWSDDYTAPQGTAAPAAAPQVRPKIQPAQKPTTPAVAARGNGAAIAPKAPAAPAPAIPSPALELLAMLPDEEPIADDLELPSEPVAAQADASFGLDFIDEQHEQADEQAVLETAPAAPDTRVIPHAPVVSEAPRPVSPPPPLPARHEERLPQIEPAAIAPTPKALPIEQPAEDQVDLAGASSTEELGQDEMPLALEPEAVASEEDEFSWHEEVAEVATPAPAQPEQALEEISAPSEAARIELPKDEPIAIEPVATTPPQAPERQPEMSASERETLTFAAAAAEPAETAEVTHAVERGSEDAGSPSDLGLLAAESLQDAELVDADAEDDNDPFASLVDSLEVADDALEAPSEPIAAPAQPARSAGSNGNGAVPVTSAAKKSAAAFTDEDIDAALNEALRHLDGLDDLSEAAAPARARPVGR